MYYLGIDIGAVTAKAALLSKEGSFFHGLVIPAGYNRKKTAEKLIDQIITEKQISRDHILSAWATGYGKKAVPFADRTVTEITCHAAGAHFLLPDTGTIIDIGGQDSKGIRVDPRGRVLDFVMNDKCSAGTGRFLEVMAHALETDLDFFGNLADESENPVSISSTCTVFAESEVIGHLSAGRAREDIIAGIHLSIAQRIRSMISSIGINDPVVMTGGVAKNHGMQRALSQVLKINVTVPREPQLAGALGAAVLARAGGND